VSERNHFGKGAGWFVWYVVGMLALVIGACWQMTASAQTVPGSLTLRWTLPSTGCIVGASPAVCGQALTGAHALQAVHVWISTSQIADPPSGAPTLTLAAGATTATHTMQVTNGQTLYARVSARASADGVLSNQVTKLISLPVAPGAPTNVTIELVIAP
jgi:hypothetical protein